MCNFNKTTKTGMKTFHAVICSLKTAVDRQALRSDSRFQQPTVLDILQQPTKQRLSSNCTVIPYSIFPYLLFPTLLTRTLIFRTCVFHPCLAVLEFSILVFSSRTHFATLYFSFPYLHFPVLAISAPPARYFTSSG